SPDLFEPRLEQNRLVGWWYRTSKAAPYGGGGGSRIPVLLSEVIQSKYANPFDPLRGITPIAAAAAQINLDMLADQHNQSIVANGADPGGILTYDGQMDPAQEEESLKRWR